MTAAYLPETATAPSVHVIVIGNEKGGAGKSTVAMHLTVALLRMGKRVGVVDLDVRQRSLARYVENRARSVREHGKILPMPAVGEMRASLAPNRPTADAEEAALLDQTLNGLAARCDYIVIDSPGGDTNLARLAHARADTLITPLNDSFVDFDLLGDVDPTTNEIVRPSLYAEMVWESRKRKARADRRPIDWVVMRNRLAPGKIEAKNKKRVGDAMTKLSTRIGFRIAPGLSERVIFRELFPLGLTLIDLGEPGAVDGAMKMAHLAARQELRDLMIVLRLPGLEGEALRF
jgi:chromosome partitioning protein